MLMTSKYINQKSLVNSRFTYPTVYLPSLWMSNRLHTLHRHKIKFLVFPLKPFFPHFFLILVKNNSIFPVVQAKKKKSATLLPPFFPRPTSYLSMSPANNNFQNIPRMQPLLTTSTAIVLVQTIVLFLVWIITVASCLVSLPPLLLINPQSLLSTQQPEQFC